MDETCNIDGCENKHKARGLCNKHYLRLRIHGNPEHGYDTPEERFWDKVDVGEPGECWEWGASRNSKGYGQFGLDGRIEYAHRIVWRLTQGEIPDGKHICHRCDNPPCVNPRHLFPGTHQENMFDRDNKGRRDARGSKNGQAKLTEKDIRPIRALLDEGLKLTAIADLYGVSPQAVSMIKNGKRWNHVE